MLKNGPYPCLCGGVPCQYRGFRYRRRRDLALLTYRAPFRLLHDRHMGWRFDSAWTVVGGVPGGKRLCSMMWSAVSDGLPHPTQGRPRILALFFW